MGKTFDRVSEHVSFIMAKNGDTHILGHAIHYGFIDEVILSNPLLGSNEEEKCESCATDTDLVSLQSTWPVVPPSMVCSMHNWRNYVQVLTGLVRYSATDTLINGCSENGQSVI